MPPKVWSEPLPGWVCLGRLGWVEGLSCAEFVSKSFLQIYFCIIFSARSLGRLVRSLVAAESLNACGMYPSLLHTVEKTAWVPVPVLSSVEWQISKSCLELASCDLCDLCDAEAPQGMWKSALETHAHRTAVLDLALPSKTGLRWLTPVFPPRFVGLCGQVLTIRCWVIWWNEFIGESFGRFAMVVLDCVALSIYEELWQTQYADLIQFAGSKILHTYNFEEVWGSLRYLRGLLARSLIRGNPRVKGTQRQGFFAPDSLYSCKWFRKIWIIQIQVLETGKTGLSLSHLSHLFVLFSMKSPNPYATWDIYEMDQTWEHLEGFIPAGHIQGQNAASLVVRARCATLLGFILGESRKLQVLIDRPFGTVLWARPLPMVDRCALGLDIRPSGWGWEIEFCASKFFFHGRICRPADATELTAPEAQAQQSEVKLHVTFEDSKIYSRHQAKPFRPEVTTEELIRKGLATQITGVWHLVPWHRHGHKFNRTQKSGERETTENCWQW